MAFSGVIYSDVGIKRATNQDSLLLRVADTQYGQVLFAAVCDGMGGLARGELASATLVRALADWFSEEFPDLLYKARTQDGIERTELENSLNAVVQNTNRRIAGYARQFRSTMGTTAAVLLMAEEKWYTLNVGDSRVYRMSDGRLLQITIDQTFVQREIDRGRLTPEEAEVHPRRNVLLQCVGASEELVPEFAHGIYAPGSVFMLCSDGFRHVIKPEEFAQFFAPERLTSEQIMRETAVYCTELCKSRQEKDNISVALVKVQ